jgi:hypothetical protein
MVNIYIKEPWAIDAKKALNFLCREWEMKDG